MRERLDWAGGVVEPLDEDSRPGRRARGDAARASDAFAICFLHSYVNPAHEERAARDRRARSCRTRSSCHSAELLREPPEFERTSTTVINATLMPVVTDYLSALERRLRDAGFAGRLDGDALGRRPDDRGHPRRASRHAS